MSNTPTGYTVKLVYYGRADFRKYVWGKGEERSKTVDLPTPQVSTQNIRIVAFSSPDPESSPEIGIYELVRNAEAPKSDLEGTKIA